MYVTVQNASLALLSIYMFGLKILKQRLDKNEIIIILFDLHSVGVFVLVRMDTDAGEEGTVCWVAEFAK